MSYGSFSAHTLTDMALNTLQSHMADELNDQLERDGLDNVDFPPPKSWQMLQDVDDLTIDQSPLVVVTTPGLVGEPSRMAGGKHRASWIIDAYVFVRGQSYDDVRIRVFTYAAALRTTLGRWRVGAIYPTRWVDESYAEIPSEQTRTLGGAVVSFVVDVSDVLDDLAREPGATVTNIRTDVRSKVRGRETAFSGGSGTDTGTGTGTDGATDYADAYSDAY